MAYETLGEVTIVSLGGVNKLTGKPNPTQVEGYLMRVEVRPGKFKEQQFYVLKTSKGDVGFYGKTDIDRKLKSATIGAMTLVRATDEVKDTGKGNPMKVFHVGQDRANTIDSAAISDQNFEDSDSIEEEAEEQDDYTPPRVAAPAVPASVNMSKQASVQALLNKNRSKSA